MNLARLFARLSIYRAARGVPTWVLVALALGLHLLACSGKAEASQFAGVDCNTNYKRPTESEAAYCGDKRVQSIKAAGTQFNARLMLRFTSTSHQVQRSDNGGPFYADSNWSWTTACPTGQQPNPDNDWNCQDPAQACLAKPPLGSTKVQGGSGTACVGGCVYGSPSDTIGIDFGDGQGFLYNTTGWKPTGGTCTTDTVQPSTHDAQTCKPAPNGQTFCIKPDGQQCASASTGRQICWRPGETGQKTDRDVAQKRNPGTDTTPPTPPPGETMNPKYPPQTTTTTVNNTTITTTLTTGTTGSGTDAGGPGGTDSGQPGDGSGSGDGEGDGPGQAGAVPSFADAPWGDERTVASVIAAHKARIEAAPIAQATTGFFTVQASGSCPTWTLPATPYTPSVVMDFWCVSELSTVWTVIGAVCLICFGWVAFRIGVL